MRRLKQAAGGARTLRAAFDAWALTPGAIQFMFGLTLGSVLADLLAYPPALVLTVPALGLNRAAAWLARRRA